MLTSCARPAGSTMKVCDAPRGASVVEPQTAPPRICVLSRLTPRSTVAPNARVSVAIVMLVIATGDADFDAHPTKSEPAANVAWNQSGTRNVRSEEHTSELQSRQYLVCRLLLEKKKTNTPASSIR